MHNFFVKNFPVVFLFTALSFNAFSQTPPATFTAAIGSPANGSAHYLSLTWAAVGGATSYELQYSTDGSLWNALSSGTPTTYNHNTGALGNMPFYYRVRTIVGAGQSAWKNCTQYPIYTACDVPSLPQLTGAGNVSMTVTLVPESPDPNPNYTNYSIYCTTTSQYVQANGTLGTTEVFRTMSAWGTTTVTGLSASTNYCFYSKAKNNDGDLRVATGGTIIAVEPFTTKTNFSTRFAAPIDTFWSPATCTTGGLKYFSTGGCTGGYVGFTGAWNNYFGCFLRTPQWNCTGNTSVVINFDLSNSYIATHIKSSPSSSDAIRFYMWVDNGYKNATSVKIGGVEVSSIDGNGTWLKFDAARTCVNVSVTFDLSASSNLSNILFFLEPNCSYNDSYVFSAGIDNVSLQQTSGAATACLSTTACVQASIQTDPVTQTVCAGDNASFSVGISGLVTSYQWQVRNNSSSNWSNVSNGAFYSGATAGTLNITGVTTGLNGFQYRCIVTSTCNGTVLTSNLAALIVSSSVAASVNITTATTTVCSGSSVTFTASTPNGSPSFQWKINGINAGNNSSSFTTNSLNNTDAVTCEMSSNASCVTGSPALSNSLTMTVNPSGSASVNITASATSICPGNPVNFTASPVNGGSSPTYQWKINGSSQLGANTSTFSSATLNNNDVITCVMTSNAACVTNSPAGSNAITMNVGTGGAVAGTITALQDTVCNGNPVSLSVNGSSGNIQWQSSAAYSGIYNNLGGAVNTSYINVLNQTTYFRVVATSGNCSDTSDIKTIPVKPAPVADFSFTTSGSQVSFNSGGSSGDVTAFHWDFADGNTSQAPNPVYTYSNGGLYHVCLNVTNGSNCSYTICRDVQAGFPTGVHSVNGDSEWKIYPNPVSDKLVVLGNAVSGRAEICDLLGRVWMTNEMKEGVTEKTIDLSGIPAGIYFLRINSGNNTDVLRIVKQ